MKIFFTEKNFFYREKYKLKCKRYISHFKNLFFYIENVYVTNKIFILQKSFFDLKKYIC